MSLPAERVFITGASSGIGVDVIDRAALAAAARDFIAVNRGAGISQGPLTEQAHDLAVFDAVFATNVNATMTIVPGYIDTLMTRVNRFPMPFLMQPDRFATRAVAAIPRGEQP
ncbi:hypothetical protein AB2N08_21065 [Massilia aurea]|uniref:hypothetical protein n=1 Tax=Massilia aurea TaxID=373040 RepID=UPI00346337A1